MYSQCLIFLIIIILTNDNRADKPMVLHIGALFDSEHPSIYNGRQELHAAEMATEDINLQHEYLFDGLYTLRLLSNNSRVDNKIYFYVFIFDLFSVIQCMLLMLSFMQFFVVHNYCF